MNKVRGLTRGDYTLVHGWTVDCFGLSRNFFEIIYQKDGTTIHNPFFGRIRISNYDRGDTISGDDISSYGEKEYEAMLEEQVKYL